MTFTRPISTYLAISMGLSGPKPDLDTRSGIAQQTALIMQGIHAGLSRGLTWEWTMQFGSGSAMASDRASAEALEDEDARAEALKYAEAVEAAEAAQHEAAEAALVAMIRGDFDAALARVEEATAAKAQFGDAPEWKDVLDMLSGLVDAIDDN